VVPTETIGTERLVLTPLRVEDADELAEVLGDPRLHRFIGGRPDTVEELRARYAAMTAGSGRADERWRNWVVRRREDGRPVGTVQATLTRDGGRWTAAVAWVVGVPWQQRGYATEAARALVGWLHGQDVHQVVAHIHPDHLASAQVAARAGLRPTPELVDGEQVWRLLAPPGERPPRIADRLAVARRRLVVGRAAELALFGSALAGQEPPFALLFVHGPGGVGKTVLLGEFARLAGDAGVPVVRLDGRDLDPSPAGFLAALGRALDLPPDRSPLDALGRRPRGVLLVDTYETLGPLDAWTRETLLPALPGRHLVVLAGRDPPATGWLADAGWRDLARVVPLRNLRPEESRAYLGARGVPAAQHPAALAFTHGHPLALSLVADVSASGGDPTAVAAGQRPDVVRALLERFVERLPGERHRQALEACAHVRVTTEALLAAALDAGDAHELFGWLRRLSFVEEGPHGLFPHDLAREVLDADLRWRNPDSYLALHRRVRRFIVGHLRQARGLDRQLAFFDLLYLHRNNPIMRASTDWVTLGTAHAEPATPKDREAVLSLVRRHEGEASARIAEHWWRRQPEAFAVFRRSGGELVGFVAGLALHRAGPADLEADPAAAAALRFADRHGPARPGEELFHYRFWMGTGTYQTVGSAWNLMAATSALEWLTNPRLAWSFVVFADPDAWHPTLTYLNQRRATEAGFEVGGRRWAVYAHDWRAEPALAWLDRMAERELATDQRVEVLEAELPAPLLVLSEPEFQAAVRQALRDLRRPDALAANPLLRSRLATRAAGGTPTAATLQELLGEAAAALRADPRDERLYQALACTFFEPAATQELAAERLGLPFSTYRYQLAGAIRRVTERLWRHELHGAGDAPG
jgi:RimJ/RimL family protein N-acetyltransferase